MWRGEIPYQQSHASLVIAYLLLLFSKEFMFDEQYGLVETHLQMLDGNENLAGNAAVTGTKTDEDEEWSSCDSDEEMQS